MSYPQVGYILFSLVELVGVAVLGSEIDTWAHFPYRSMTAYTLGGMPVAAGPWSTPFT